MSDIDYSDVEENEYLITGTVKSLSGDLTSLVLDLNGTAEYAMTIRKDVSDLPRVGDYICARYLFEGSSLVFVGYEELDNPGELTEVTYPVEKMAGSRIWLLTNGDDSGAEDGYRDYLIVDYGTADIYHLPLEGEEATVLYHDVAFGERTDIDERALAIEVMSSDDDAYTEESDSEFDSADTPGYIKFADKYGDLIYGNDVYHVANVIGRPDDKQVDPSPVPGGDDSPQVTPTPAPTPSSANTTSQKSSTKTSSSRLPSTGDSLAGLEGLLSTAAVGGAAAVAYSVHRRESEADQPSEEA